MTRRALKAACAALLGLSMFVLDASAQEFPSQPIRVIVPNSPAGPGDVIARHFADRATKILGQPLVFEYRPGATTTLGTNIVAKAKPDGYTILAFPSSGLTATLLRKGIPYNLREDFRPITGLGSVPLVLMVEPGLKVQSIDELAAAMKKNPLSYGSGGVGTLAHLTSLALLNELGGTGTHAAYRGNTEAMVDLIGGRLDFFFGAVADAVTAGGKVKMLAITSDRRSKSLEDVPTTAELGRSTFNPRLWYAFLAPKETPTDRVLKMHAAFAEAANDPSMQAQLDKLGFNIEIRNAEELNKMMDAETTRWKQLIDKNNIVLED